MSALIFPTETCVPDSTLSPLSDRGEQQPMVFTPFLRHRNSFLLVNQQGRYPLPGGTHDFLKFVSKMNSSSKVIPLTPVSNLELYARGGGSEGGELIPEQTKG